MLDQIEILGETWTGLKSEDDLRQLCNDTAKDGAWAMNELKNDRPRMYPCLARLEMNSTLDRYFICAYYLYRYDIEKAVKTLSGLL